MKKILITMPDESVWSVEAWRVAEDYANYRTLGTNNKYGSDEWKKERNSILDDDLQLKEWLLGDMDWVDLHADMVQPPPDVDYEDMLMEATLSVQSGDASEPSLD